MSTAHTATAAAIAPSAADSKSSSTAAVSTAIAAATAAAAAVTITTPAPVAVSRSLCEAHPPIEPYETGHLVIPNSVHRIYYERSGLKGGKPILFLHGGPGAGCSPSHRALFDPKIWDVVLFDQRGCGKSTPRAMLKELTPTPSAAATAAAADTKDKSAAADTSTGGLQDNTTWHLVSDIELLRTKLGIKKWVVLYVLHARVCAFGCD